ENLTGFPPIAGNSIQFFEGQESIYQALTQSISEAQKTIFMEYYIFKPDSIGEHFRDILISKARQGVTIKLLLDHVGSFSLNEHFLAPMRAAGIEVSFFGPLTIKRPWGFQLRNHRKLALIDHKQAFMGSQNICSDYKQWRMRKLDWIDNQILIEGPSVKQLESVFSEDWEFTTGQKVQLEETDFDSALPGTSILQLLPTGPDEHKHAFEELLMALIHSAQDQITLLSPYFVPTEAIAISLESAARRGVRVNILVPQKSDHWLVDMASKSWHWELLHSGVKISESPESFIHAKQVTVDNAVSLIGSANMDERSFRLNFECSAIIFDETIGKTLQKSFFHRYEKSQSLHINHFESEPFLLRVRNGLFKLLSPLL
ncbi:MAG: cardiolipin synthase, partial [Proteobacteria bacterium]|nr:cardiolipin synthase [Pseudomonadota bacterium]